MSNRDLQSFVDVPWDETPELPVLDRSTLELWGNCPKQAKLKADGQGHVGLAAVSGNEIHDAISEVIQEYLDANEQMGKHDLAKYLRDRIRYARPDVQPDAIAGMAEWLVASVIYSIPVGGIMRFDGGEGSYGGQLAWDINGIRATFEVDLLAATASPEVVRLIDWKSGWSAYSIERVASDFQFQFYAWGVLKNYPDVQQVDVVIVNTRKRFCTPTVTIRRSKLTDIEARITRCVSEYKLWSGRDDAPAWPAPEKCRWCDVALACDAFTAANQAAAMIRQQPSLAVDALVAYERLHDIYVEELTAIYERTGKAIVGQSGAKFGPAPPSTKKRPCKLLKD